MYSKEALYTALLDKGGSNKKKKKNNESDILPKHIKKIKDVILPTATCTIIIY